MQNNLIVFDEKAPEQEIFKFMDYAQYSLGSNTGAKVTVKKNTREVISECGKIRFLFRRNTPKLFNMVSGYEFETVMFSGCVPSTRVINNLYSRAQNIEISKKKITPP